MLQLLVEEHDEGAERNVHGVIDGETSVVCDDSFILKYFGREGHDLDGRVL